MMKKLTPALYIASICALGTGAVAANYPSPDFAAPHIRGRGLFDVQPQIKGYNDLLDFSPPTDGVSDSTPALSSLLAIGGVVHIPAGTWSVNTVTNTTKVHVVCDQGATLVQRTGGDADRYVILNTAGSDGTTISNCTFDGNLSAIGASFVSHGRFGQANVWTGVRSNYVNDITIENSVFQNFANAGWEQFGGDRFTASNVLVRNSGACFITQGTASGNHGVGYSANYRVDAKCQNIGNGAYAIFQHAATGRFLRDSSFRVTVDGFSGNTTGLEPMPIGVGFDSMDRVTIDLDVNGYTGNAPHVGVLIDSMRGVTGSIKTFGYEAGIIANSSQGCDLTVDLDGNYKNVAGYAREGLLATIGGVFGVSGAGLAGETSANLGANACTFHGRSTRFGIGVADEGSSNIYPGFQSYGNKGDGFQLRQPSIALISYPGAPLRFRPSVLAHLIGCASRDNGGAGVYVTSGDRALISGCTINSNGQSLTPGAQNGIIAVPFPAGAAITNLRIIDNDLDDTNPGVDTGGMSYAPGGTNASNQFDVILRNPNSFEIGQSVKLYNVLSGGMPATGKIVERLADIVTVQFAAAQNLLSLPLVSIGTGSTSGTVMTVPGGGLNAAIDFPVYIKHPTLNEFQRIVYVTSDTTANIDNAFSAAIPAGSALQIVRGNVSGVAPSQVNPVNINGVTSMTLRGNRITGTPYIDFTSLSGAQVGSEFTTSYSSSISTSSLSTAIVNGIPANFQITNVLFTVTASILGTTGTNSVVVKDNATVIATAINPILSVGIGAVAQGPIPNSPAILSGLGGVYFVSSAGIPTAGAATVTLTLRKIN